MYEIVENLLKERGITAYKVAQDTGITTATLSSWKKGRYTPTREKLQKIRPCNLAQAGRIPGVSPSDLAQLSLILLKANRTQNGETL